ncbi:MAG: Gp58 domain-containing protein [Pseudolactococcus raffinolactis]|jgi:hypothetical protein|uniref:hypothetical protein n=1 Tax=Pseudolactococcus raffinolactis TaxID=1366 RepID=UPI003A5B9F6F
MLQVSNDFNQALKADNRRFETRIKINGKLYTKKDINSWTYTGGSISGETFQIGSTFSNSIKIEFCSIIEDIKELDEITLEIGVATYDADYHYENIPPEKVGEARVGYAKLIHYKPTVYEYVPMGTFYVTKSDPDRNGKKTTVEARDSFVFLENLYVSELSYPAKIRDVALEIANKSGSVINETNFSMISSSMIAKPIGYTYRQAMGLIAQFQAGYVRFNKLNQLEVMQLVDPEFSISPAEYFQRGLVKNELMYQIGGISCTISVQKASGTEQVTLKSGSNTGPQIVLENKVMTQDLLDSIYQKIKNINFYPFSLKWRGNPALETGDWITLTDRDGTPFKTPNLSYTLSFKGGLTATSSASTNSSAQTVSAYTKPLEQTLKEFSSRIDAAGNNSVYDGLTPPPYPKVGDIWFKKSGPDDEIWIYSKISDDKYDWVLQTSTKLPDDIANKIENATPSDEIVKTINLSKETDGKEWLKITGAKIWLTDQTRIDDAIIKDAMIGNLSASKINAGTLNAASVNVVNLNAKSLSAGTISGNNLSINLDTGAVQFQKGYIAGNNSKIRFDLDKNYFQSLNDLNQGFVVKDGIFNFYSSYSLNDGIKIGDISSDMLAEGGGIQISGEAGVFLSSKKYVASIGIGTGGLAKGNEVSIFGDTYFWDDLMVLGKKNAIHVTRDGVRGTPAYETAESYLGDIGGNYTRENCEVWVDIEKLFSDTVNTDIAYHVFLQAYDDAHFWVAEFKSDKFLIKSDKPMARFSWEIKAKRRGYENDRLVIQEGVDNKILLEAHSEGIFKGDSENE